MGLFSEESPDIVFLESETSKAARKRIEEISQISAEGIPLREIAPLSELEQQAFVLAGEFLRDATGEITIDKAIEVASQIAEQKIDLNAPEIQGIIQEVRKTGDLALNRIGRALQARGVASTTAGRDILGRSVAETELRTAGALQPILSEFRGRRLQAASLLPSLVAQRGAVTTGRIATGVAAGEAQRSLQQRINDALALRQEQMFAFETTGRASIANLLLEAPQPVVRGGGPSELQRIASAGSQIASLIDPASKVIGGISKLLTPAAGTGAGTVGAGGGLPGLGGLRFPNTRVA